MKYWIVSWDCNGVEFFKDITEDHPDNRAKQQVFDTIKEGRKVERPSSFSLTGLMLRAQANHHRHYEIYMFTSDDDLGEAEIQTWFESDPQGFADWVRKNHSYKIYDNSVDPAHKPVIV
jgi:hypothetical protein